MENSTPLSPGSSNPVSSAQDQTAVTGLLLHTHSHSRTQPQGVRGDLGRLKGTIVAGYRGGGEGSAIRREGIGDTHA